MLKKSLLLLAALLFCAGANLRPCCVYELDGVPLAPGVSLRDARLAETAAREAAEEILRLSPGPTRAERRVRLTLRRPAGDARTLSDALLRATDGVVCRDEVRIDGRRLGWVADGDALRAALRGYMENTLPAWASGGVLSRELDVRRRYTRDGYLTPEGDMVLLVTGAAPVFYFDDTGRFARA